MTTVLIVDDSVFMRSQLKKLLKKIGFSVIGESENGKDAIIKIRQLNPELVTLDITMPEMNGIECLEEINKMDNKPNIIIISAMGQVQLVQKAIMLGVKGFIVKPYKDADVVSQLKAFTNTNP